MITAPRTFPSVERKISNVKRLVRKPAEKEITDKRKFPSGGKGKGNGMGNVLYSAHISNGKSAINSKSRLSGVAKHNLREIPFQRV